MVTPEFMESKNLWSHHKRGSYYRVLFCGSFQCSGDPNFDNRDVVVYESPSGKKWIRSRHEFMDGRFEPRDEVAVALLNAWKEEIAKENKILEHADRIKKKREKENPHKPDKA